MYLQIKVLQMSNAIWFQRTVYSVISLLFIIWLISPQNSLPQAIPAPEFLLCLTLVVILRKPEVLPVTVSYTHLTLPTKA